MLIIVSRQVVGRTSASRWAAESRAHPRDLEATRRVRAATRAAHDEPAGSLIARDPLQPRALFSPSPLFYLFPRACRRQRGAAAGATAGGAAGGPAPCAEGEGPDVDVTRQSRGGDGGSEHRRDERRSAASAAAGVVVAFAVGRAGATSLGEGLPQSHTQCNLSRRSRRFTVATAPGARATQAGHRTDHY